MPTATQEDEDRTTVTVEALAALPEGAEVTVREDNERRTWVSLGNGNLSWDGRTLPATFFRGAAAAGRVHIPGVEATADAAPTYAERMRVDQPLRAGEVMRYNDESMYYITEAVTFPDGSHSYKCAITTGNGAPVRFASETFASILTADYANGAGWSRYSAGEVAERWPMFGWLQLAKDHYTRPRMTAHLIRHANDKNDVDLMNILVAGDVGVTIHDTKITVDARTRIDENTVPAESLGVDGEVTSYYATEILWRKDMVVQRAVQGEACSCYDFNSTHVSTLLPENAQFRDYRVHAH